MVHLSCRDVWPFYSQAFHPSHIQQIRNGASLWRRRTRGWTGGRCFGRRDRGHVFHLLDDNEALSGHLGLLPDESMWEEPFLRGDMLTNRTISTMDNKFLMQPRKFERGENAYSFIPERMSIMTL